MKCVILAGGRGTRISEESNVRPKPMVEIGTRPILWHIMKLYSAFGINDFVVCLGYKGYVIKEYFANYFLHQSDVTIDLAGNNLAYHDSRSEPWKITLVDTGEDTMTGGRLRRVRNYLDPDVPFCMTYGDGLSNIDIKAQISFHVEQRLLATVACVRPPARFGRVAVSGSKVAAFVEKPQSDGGLINGGFFVLEPAALDLVDGDETVWEQEPLERLASSGQLSAWIHNDFWQAVDTLRDKNALNALWESGNAPWKLWQS